MATSFSITHDFDCDPATYWEIFWDEAFNVEQYERMKCGRKLIAQRDEGATRIRDQEVAPDRQLPAMLQALLGGKPLAYLEHGVFRMPGGPLEVAIKVPILGDRFEIKSVYTVKETTPGKCRREYAGECFVRIPLVGGKAENAIIRNMNETYEAAAQTHREWIARRKS